uniref:ATP-dependent endonuclease n=1 Tax=candidate division WOR-3 bacterium TaxID=2052148 RepID=A0A7V4E4I7_UNCW3
MIKKIKIENFRSIENIEIELGKFNALIGPNNAGKSNIMRALNLVLGETYPTAKSFDDKDFYKYDKTKPISIIVLFDQPLTCKNKVYGFKLTYDGNDCDYIAIDNQENELTYSSGRLLKVSSEMKEEVVLMYLSLDRLAAKQLSPSKWTIYGKLLKNINSKIDPGKKEEFKNKVQEGYANIYSTIQEVEDRLKEYIRGQTGLDVALKFSILDPMEVIKNLRPYFKEGNMEYDPEDMGAGTQSALAIAIARTYAEIVRKPLIIAIEEPELYLHPHGCRHFYKILKNLADEGLQIIYTTHERSFVDIRNFESIHIVRKENEKTVVYSGLSLSMTSQFDEVKAASKFNEYLNEVFFAEHVILVEGFSDKVACQLALEKLGLDLDLKNISITECGSKTAIKPIAEILKHFSINTYVLIDSDAQKEISELETMLGEEYVFIQDPDLEGMLGRDKLGLRGVEKLNKEKALKLLPEYFEKNEVPKIYQELYKLFLGNIYEVPLGN